MRDTCEDERARRSRAQHHVINRNQLKRVPLIALLVAVSRQIVWPQVNEGACDVSVRLVGVIGQVDRLRHAQVQTQRRS